jgi:predicted HTH transcriptional regulator
MLMKIPIYIGLKDTVVLTGIQIGKASLEDLTNTIAVKTTPPICPNVTIITTTDLQRLSDAPSRTARRDLQQLVKKGILRKRGQTRDACYEPN